MENSNAGVLTRLQLPGDLVAEIFLRCPAKSVARFRCVSTTWLSISTDHSFILAHASRAPKSFLLQPFLRSNSIRPEILLSFSITGIGERRFGITPDTVKSTADGLVLIKRAKRLHSSHYYVLNILTGLQIDLPNSNMMYYQVRSQICLFYHRWTRKYRVIQIVCCKGPGICYYLEANVLSLTDAYKWRHIEVNVHFPSSIHLQTPALVKDRLHWTYNSDNILVFDILKETFSILQLPCGPQTDCGLIEIEDKLCFWTLHRDKSFIEDITINIWTVVDGDAKWMRTYSICPLESNRWGFYRELYSINKREILLINDIMDNTLNFFIWDIKSGKCRIDQVLVEFNMGNYHEIFICRETLIDGPVQPQNNRTKTGFLQRCKAFICLIFE